MRILISSILLFCISSFAFAQGPSVDKLKVGDEAVGFQLLNVDGSMVSPDTYPEAKGFIIVFTCNHCPFSKKYETRINELNVAFAERGYPVIAINPNDPDAYPEDSYEAMQARSTEKGFTFDYLWDETQEIARSYGATKTPHTFVVTRHDDGSLVVSYIGAIDDSVDGSDVGQAYVAEAVNALLNGETPEQTETKAVGCSIKWRD